MKRAIISLLLLYVSIVSVAQKPDTLTVAQMENPKMTPEKLLGLGNEYRVLKCQFRCLVDTEFVIETFARPHSHFVSKETPAGKFSGLWTMLMAFSTWNYDHIIVEEIIVEKDHHEMTWPAKAFVLPVKLHFSPYTKQYYTEPFK